MSGTDHPRRARRDDAVVARRGPVHTNSGMRGRGRGAGSGAHVQPREPRRVQRVAPCVRGKALVGRPVTYDFFSYDTVVDPYPVFERLREQDPVYATNFGYWYVSRYDDANRLLRDGSLGAGRGVPDSMGITSGPLYDLMTTWMMAIDGPAHSRVRRLVSRAFTPRAVEAMRPDIEALADGLCNRLEAHGGGDLVADYAFPLPMEVV